MQAYNRYTLPNRPESFTVTFAMQQGIKAARTDGMTINSCPYTQGTELAQAWEDMFNKTVVQDFIDR
jgi:coenzyme F420-reducing hydrogenase delta subunit